MDVLKNWMFWTWERQVDGALIDDIKFMKDTAQPSNSDLGSVGGSECDVLREISNEDLEYVEATTHLDMSFYRKSSSQLRNPSSDQ